MYYLQSRYYNPEWGRFINADAIAGRIGELLGYNLFTYCKNNPIGLKDPNGYRHMRAYGDEDENIVEMELTHWNNYVTDNRSKAQKFYKENKNVRIAAKAEMRIAETAVAYAGGGEKIGSIIAKKLPSVPGIDKAVPWAMSEAYEIGKDTFEVYSDDDIAVIFVEGHRAKIASDAIGDLYGAKALDNLIYKVKIFLKNPGTDKNWKHSTRGFDY